MPQPKIHENAAARNRAYRQRQKQRASPSNTSAAATALQSLHAAIGGAQAAGDATATAVYRSTATDTADALTNHFFRASIGGAAEVS